MKCCLNSNLPPKMLEKADQIKFVFKDRKSIIDYVEYGKTIILEMLTTKEKDWNEIIQNNTLCKEDFILCIASIEDAKIANNLKIKWYWGYPVSTFYEAKALERLGSCYLKIGAPLFFNFEKVKKVLPNMKIRHTPNIAYNDGLPRIDGVSGTWIRPEDILLYDDYIDIIEFEDCDRGKEQTLYSIYMEQHEWSTIFSLLITNFKHSGVNRLISSELTKRRMKCSQSCENGGTCTLCWRSFDLADPDRLRKYAEAQGLLPTT